MENIDLEKISFFFCKQAVFAYLICNIKATDIFRKSFPVFAAHLRSDSFNFELPEELSWTSSTPAFQTDLQPIRKDDLIAKGSGLGLRGLGFVSVMFLVR